MPDQELRSAVIYQLAALPHPSQELSITKTQQLAYLLQEATGLPTTFRHRLRYGSPSSDQVHNTISLLTTTGYISTHPHPNPRALTRLIKVDSTPNPSWQKTVAPYAHAMAQCLETLKDRTDTELDMIASSHIINAIMSNRDTDPPTPQCVIARVKALKPKYDWERIAQALEIATALTI